MNKEQIIKNIIYRLKSLELKKKKKSLEFVLWALGKQMIFGLTNYTYILGKSLVWKIKKKKTFSS